ncbi:MAG: SurA N-terminal domain-containing protein [Paludibacteraceae bacterium]|nr:SurA N-terminal domain-containing protein [Paludibacteraceae bacterium]
MATLEKIRQKGVLLSIVIGVAMLLFIIGMVDFNSIFGTSRQKVAEVDGEEINIMDYEKRIDEMTSFYKVEMGQSSLPDQYNEQIRTAVWNSYVKEIILGKSCEKLGIVISDDEMAQNLTGDAPHPMLSQLSLFYNQQKGGFDKEILFQLLHAVDNEPNGDIAKYWSFVQRTVKNQLLEDKYNALIGASININNLDAKYNFDGNKSADIAYTVTPYTSIADSTINADKSEIKKYYKENKNKYYNDAESRTIKILTYDVVPSESDFTDVQEWINGIKDEFFTSDEYIAVCNQNSDTRYTDVAQSKANVDSDLSDFAFSGKAGDTFGPQLFGNTYKMARIVETGISASDSAKVRHILVQEGSDEKTKTVADSLLKLIAGGADFASLAKQFSKAGTGAAGGELGWLKDGDYDKEFSSACIKGTVGKAFELPMGQAIQIIEVTEKTKPVAKVKLCVLQRTVEASSQTIGTIFNDASQYMAQNNDIEKFESNADAAKGQFVRSYTVSAADNKIADIKDSRQIIRWAFENNEGDVADKVFECGDKFVVAALSNIDKEGFKSLEDVEEQIISEVKKQKKGETIAADIQTKLSNGDIASTGAVLNTSNVTLNSQYVSGIGMEPKLVAVVSCMTPESAPQIIKGNNGVYAVKVVSQNEAGEFDAASQIGQLSSRRPYRYMVYSSLEKSANIIDNRITFY